VGDASCLKQRRSKTSDPKALTYNTFEREKEKCNMEEGEMNKRREEG
jgi:hypothetical protein